MRGLFKMPIGIGISSLMMIFIGLTMACVMSLTLMTSYRDYQLTHKEIESIQAYERAEKKANALLMEVEEIYEIYETSMSARADLLEKALVEIEEVTNIQFQTDVQMTYKIAVDPERNLKVVLKMPLKKTDISKYVENKEDIENENINESSYINEAEGVQIISWQVVQEKKWQYEEESFGQGEVS